MGLVPAGQRDGQEDESSRSDQKAQTQFRSSHGVVSPTPDQSLTVSSEVAAGLHPVVDGRSTQAHLYDRDAARELAAHLRRHSAASHSHHHDIEIDDFAHRHGLRRHASPPIWGRMLTRGHDEPFRSPRRSFPASKSVAPSMIP